MLLRAAARHVTPVDGRVMAETTMGESPKHTALIPGGPVPFSAMMPGHFWASAAAIGSTPEEMDALGRNALAAERRGEIEERLAAEYCKLRDAVPPGFNHYLPWKRNMN